MPVALPAVIARRGAGHNDLRDIDVGVPLWRTAAVVGVSGSGKTLLAKGMPYEGLHRLPQARLDAPPLTTITGQTAGTE